MSNITIMTEFLLLGFSDVRMLQILHSVIFLVFYLSALVGNIVIIKLIALEPNLHKPMYFFLMNLSLADVGSVSVTIPKSMANSIFNTRVISYPECVSQVFFLIFFMATDLALLTFMAYDRYVAICNPLHYETVMTKDACIQMTAVSWIGALFYAALHTISTFATSFCSKIINQFFCEIPQLLKISCSKRYEIEVGALGFSGCLAFGSFIFIISSYVQIIRTVMRIPSIEARKKTFSTCIPHFLVVSLFIVSTAFAYLKPISNSPTHLDLVAAVIYSMLPPLMNPVIYSLRNKQIKMAMKKYILFHRPVFHYI